MLPDKLSSTSSNLDPVFIQTNPDVGASSSTPAQEAKWGMSAEMLQHMGSIRHGLDVFNLRVLLVWLGLHHMEKLPSVGVASSSSSSPVYTKEQLTELIAKHVWELNFRVVSEALIDFITALQSIWDPALPESFGILLELIKSHVESSPNRCILLTEADQDVWKERPLREFGASPIEAPVVELERYGTLMPALVEQLHSSLNNQAIEVEREQRLRTQMQEAAVELIESLPEEHRINALGMYGWVCKEMAKHVEEYHAVDLGFAKRAIKPSVARLSQSHLKAVINSTSAKNLSKHALEYKDDLDCLNEVLFGFFDSNHHRVNVVDHFLLFQYFVLYKSLSGKTYPSDNFSQMIADFQPLYKDHQEKLERQADLIHQCEELVGGNAERLALFVKFRNSCEEIRWQYRYRCLYPMLWSRLSGVIIESVSKAFPSVKREQSSRTSVDSVVAQIHEGIKEMTSLKQLVELGIKGKSVERRDGTVIVNITPLEVAAAERRAAASAMREKLQRKRARGASQATVPQFIDPEEIKRREANARALLAEETASKSPRGGGGRSKSRVRGGKVQAIRTTVSTASSSISSGSSSVGPSPSSSSSSNSAGVQSSTVVPEDKSTSTIYDAVRSKVSGAVWERPGACLQRSHETFYADAERTLAFVRSRQRRLSSLHNYVKQTLRAKAQFLLSLGIAKQCERDPMASRIPLSELSHDMWEYITLAGIEEGSLKEEEVAEIYMTSRANSSVRYHPLFKRSTGTAAEMVLEVNRLGSGHFAGGPRDDGYRVVGVEQRKAERLQKECSDQLNACLSVASRLLSCE